jgi:membrane protease YdiL (CAAX protease family)
MIHNSYNRVALSLERMNMPAYIGIFVALKLLLGYLSSHINFSVTNEPITKGFFEFGNIYAEFFLIVILAPIFETYLGQYLFFKNLTGRLPQWAIVLLSGLVFGLLHHYNIGYVLYAIPSGLLLSVSYAFRLRSNPFVSTTLIHAAYNLIVFIDNNWISVGRS